MGRFGKTARKASDMMSQNNSSRHGYRIGTDGHAPAGPIVVGAVTVASLAALILLQPTTAVAAAKSPPSPNILFILTDQHRRDCVGAYGNPKIHTPHIDRIAREGARFNRAYAAQPVCSAPILMVP